MFANAFDGENLTKSDGFPWLKCPALICIQMYDAVWPSSDFLTKARSRKAQFPQRFCDNFQTKGSAPHNFLPLLITWQTFFIPCSILSPFCAVFFFPGKGPIRGASFFLLKLKCLSPAGRVPSPLCHKDQGGFLLNCSVASQKVGDTRHR